MSKKYLITSDNINETNLSEIISDTYNAESSNAMSGKAIASAISDKVDKVSGKNLSTNDYTTDEKNKLKGIAAGAEVNVNADWNAESGDAQILNKPTSMPASDVSDWAKAKTKPTYTASEVGALPNSTVIPSKLSDLSDDATHRLITDTEKSTWNAKASTSVATTSANGLMSSTDKAKLNGIADNANNYTLPTSTSSVLGGVKSSTTGTTENRDYAVEVKTDGTMKVNVPWTDTNTTYSSKNAASGGTAVSLVTTGEKYTWNNKYSKPSGGIPASDLASGVITDTYSAISTAAMSGKAVASAIAALPEPMVFKGSLGTGGTITTLPAASSDNEGFTYKVITAGTYQSVSAEVGDTLISDGSSWILIPSGDEPSGTVTSVAVKMNNTIKGTVTSSGTIDLGTVITSHQDISGKENSSNKVTSWSTTTTDTHYPSEKLVKDALDSKAASTHTHTKSQITDFPTSMPASDVQAYAKTGSGITVAKSVPSDAKFTDTTYSNMTAATASAAGTHGLVPAPAAGKQTSFLRGDGTWVVPTNTTYSSKAAASGGTDVSLVTTGEKYTWNSKTSNTGTVTSVAVKMNNTVKGTITSSGTIDLGTVITAHQSLSGYATTTQLTNGSVTKVGTTTVGSATKPIYLNAGTPTACTNNLIKTDRNLSSIFASGTITLTPTAAGTFKEWDQVTITGLIPGVPYILYGKLVISTNTISNGLGVYLRAGDTSPWIIRDETYGCLNSSSTAIFATSTAGSTNLIYLTIAGGKTGTLYSSNVIIPRSTSLTFIPLVQGGSAGTLKMAASFYV